MCSSLSEPAMRFILLANLKLLICPLHIAILDDWSSRESYIILSRNMLNKTVDSKQPCLTPTVLLICSYLVVQ